MIGEISAVASSMTWAGSTVVVKTISGTVRPVPISAVQTCVSALALFLLAAAFGRLDDLVTMPAYAAGMLVASSVTTTVGIVAFLWAISLGAVGWTFVMTNSIFIPTSVLAGWLLLGDEITAWTWVGGGTILAGLYLLNKRRRARSPRDAPVSGQTADEDGGKVPTRAIALAALAGSRGPAVSSSPRKDSRGSTCWLRQAFGTWFQRSCSRSGSRLGGVGRSGTSPCPIGDGCSSARDWACAPSSVGC